MNIIKWVKRQRTRHTLKHHSIPYSLWKKSLRKAALLHDLSSVEKARLRRLATLFLYHKAINGARGFKLTDEMLVVIAAQAALPILKLGLNYYSNWVEVIIYPGAFRVSHNNIDPNGLSSNEMNTLSGEAWLRGPVILSWEDIEHDLHAPHLGHNVVIHEFAHKLDMLDGSADGLPPLHPTMKIKQWADVLSTAYDVLRQQVAHHHRTRINAYAATTPAEFFAVVSEYFFAAPTILNHHCPEVYQQLVQFYRQDPLARQKQKNLSDFDNEGSISKLL
ncbi:MAG: zinc-dependent peptidase [Gammaproteobacteria bacterium]|nr:zinc-dependent peptidase [Gammaproteobacteria bacterium]